MKWFFLIALVLFGCGKDSAPTAQAPSISEVVGGNGLGAGPGYTALVSQPSMETVHYGSTGYFQVLNAALPLTLVSGCGVTFQGNVVYFTTCAPANETVTVQDANGQQASVSVTVN